MVVHWLMENTSAIERRTRDGKTYYVMVDRNAFRDGVGTLLAEVQRIKSEGDYDAARTLLNRTVFILPPHSAMKLFTACRKSMCHRTLDL